LADVVAAIERRIAEWTPIESGEKAVMPNILYGTDTRDASVPGELRLRGVSPLQAVALAAAAAGCTLEPIFAPKEALDASAQRAIGYRIVRVSAFTPFQSVGTMEQPLSESARQLDSLGETLGQNHPSVVSAREYLKQLMSPEYAGSLVGIGIVLAKKDGAVVVAEVIPGSPASLAPAIKPGRRILSVAEEGKPEVDVTGLELEKVVQLIRGAPGTAVRITLAADTKLGMGEHGFSLVRAKLPVKPVDAMFPKVMVVNPNGAASGLPGLAGGGGVSGDNQGIALSGVSFTPSARGNVPFVRVYAVGSVLSGSDNEITEKESSLRQLVASAIGMSGDKTAKAPDLNFHKQSRALIVRATAGQQEIIEQVIKALKDNETQPAATAKP
jgi:hypothetical protein